MQNRKTPLSKSVNNALPKISAVVAQLRQGPIPSPEDMRGYKLVDADLPNRIIVSKPIQFVPFLLTDFVRVMLFLLCQFVRFSSDERGSVYAVQVIGS